MILSSSTISSSSGTIIDWYHDMNSVYSNSIWRYHTCWQRTTNDEHVTYNNLVDFPIWLNCFGIDTFNRIKIQIEIRNEVLTKLRTHAECIGSSIVRMFVPMPISWSVYTSVFRMCDNFIAVSHIEWHFLLLFDSIS